METRHYTYQQCWVIEVCHFSRQRLYFLHILSHCFTVLYILREGKRPRVPLEDEGWRYPYYLENPDISVRHLLPL